MLKASFPSENLGEMLKSLLGNRLWEQGVFLSKRKAVDKWRIFVYKERNRDPNLVFSRLPQ